MFIGNKHLNGHRIHFLVQYKIISIYTHHCYLVSNSHNANDFLSDASCNFLWMDPEHSRFTSCSPSLYILVELHPFYSVRTYIQKGSVSDSRETIFLEGYSRDGWQRTSCSWLYHGQNGMPFRSHCHMLRLQLRTQLSPFIVFLHHIVTCFNTHAVVRQAITGGSLAGRIMWGEPPKINQNQDFLKRIINCLFRNEKMTNCYETQKL